MWGDFNVLKILNNLAEHFNEDIESISRKYGVMRLRKSEELWCYHSNLGVFTKLS